MDRPNIAGERYKRPPTLAEADAWLAINRQLELRRLMQQLIASLYSLYVTPPDGAR